MLVWIINDKRLLQNSKISNSLIVIKRSYNNLKQIILHCDISINI